MTATEFKDIFNEHKLFVFYLCRKLSKNKEDAEDLSSQVFISLWEVRDTVDIKSIRPYLARIVKNKFTDFVKYNNARINIISASISEDVTEDVENIDMTLDVLSHIYN